jgi:hypothetical protein
MVFGLPEEYCKGYVDDLSKIDTDGIYYSYGEKYTIGVPNYDNKLVLEYTEDTGWKEYLRLTNDMIVGLWKSNVDRFLNYIELRLDGTTTIKNQDGNVIGYGTYDVTSNAYITDISIYYIDEETNEEHNLSCEYSVVDGEVRLLANAIVDGTNLYYVKQSELVVPAVGGLPIDITTDADMANALTEANVGKVYKFTGTSDTYETDAIYIVSEVE